MNGQVADSAADPETPDLTPADPIVDWARVEASRYGTVLQGAHLVGAMRKRDIAGATRLRFRAEQVVGEW